MKKLAIILALVLLTTPAFAQARGPLTNRFSSWYSIGTATTTFNMPLRTATERYTTRDVIIHNGSAVDICVDLDGGEIAADCGTSSAGQVFMLNGTASVLLQDYLTTSISIKSAVGTASPVSVIATY